MEYISTATGYILDCTSPIKFQLVSQKTRWQFCVNPPFPFCFVNTKYNGQYDDDG